MEPGVQESKEKVTKVFSLVKMVKKNPPNASSPLKKAVKHL